MDDAKAEFWGDLQSDFYTTTSTLYLANQTLETVLSTNGRKAHKPILSQPTIRDYTPHSDLTFDQKKAEKQELEVSNFPTAAEVIDITEKNQSPYDLLGHSSMAIRKGLINRTEQIFNSQFSNAAHVIGGGTYFELTPGNILEVIEEADGTLGSFDAPTDTGMKVAAFGPRTVAMLRRAKAERETGLGDSVLSNGVVGPWKGWTIVQNNNLPWSATLAIATNPTAGDTITIMGREIEIVSDLTGLEASLTGPHAYVLRGGSAAATVDNIVALINGAAGSGTTYVDFDIVSKFIIRNKRKIAAVDNTTSIALTGFGDITVSDDLTATADGFTNERQDSIFMVRGAIDLVMQFMELEVGSKEKGFADLPKGIIGVGAKMFHDGSLLSVRVPQDVSNWNA